MLPGRHDPSVRPIYGELTGRLFCPLKDVYRLPSDGLPESVLSLTEQGEFLKGRSFVKRLGNDARPAQRYSAVLVGGTPAPLSTPSRPIPVFPHESPAFTVVGLDPTAGTWETKMAGGEKQMPSFALR